MRAAALLAGWLLSCTPALALNHLQANRIHLFPSGNCTSAPAPVWLSIGTGQAAPRARNLTAPQFDEIGALLTGSQPGEAEAALAGQTTSCSLIASFYQNAMPAGAWPVTPAQLPELLAILNG